MKASIKTGVQLYSFRNELEKDYQGVMEKIAEMGFAGVEPARFPGTTLHQAAKLYGELKLEVPSLHAPVPMGEDEAMVLEQVEVLQAPRLVHTFMNPEFETLDTIRRAAEKLNLSAEMGKKYGYKTGYHNHWWEFEYLGDQLKFDLLKAELSEEIFFEIDTYWVKVGGQNPAEIISSLGSRAPLLHIKDGPGDKNSPNVPVGEGSMEWSPILSGGLGAEWFLVEFDHCDTDVIAAAGQSLDFINRF